MFRKLIGKTYVWDKNTNLVHDLQAVESDNAFKEKAVPECTELIRTIKRKHRKYLTFIEFIALWEEKKVGGCPDCLPGFNKNK